MKIYRVTDPEFSAFGRVLQMDTRDLVATCKTIVTPESGSAYEASVEALEALDAAREIKLHLGQMPTQVGYCWGHNDALNALEWHKCSEINVAVTDLILLLGDQRDIVDNRYDSAKVKAFRVLAGEAIEVYATTLHFCPIEVEASGFGCVVGLVKGTNLPHEMPVDDPLHFKQNKWILAHEKNEALLARGVVGGIYGENYRF